MDTFVTVQELNKTYGNQRGLKDISFTIGQGELKF